MSDNPRGFVPLYHLSGGTIRSNAYIAGGTIFRGDLVQANAAGNVTAAAAGAGNVVIGVAAHYATNGEVVHVYDDPNIVFAVQATTAAAADVFATANHLANAGDAVTRVSRHVLNGANIGTGTQMRILGKLDEPGNNWGANVDVAVVLVSHALRNNTHI